MKLRETPKGNVIGQYYTGTRYTADEEKDGWIHVTIGGRTGWMMSSYLLDSIPVATEPPVGTIVYPESDGCISLIDLEGREHRIPQNILNSYDGQGQPTGWGQYLTVDTVWVSCEVPVGDQNYYGWLIPVEDLLFDSGLMLPAMWTEG